MGINPVSLNGLTSGFCIAWDLCSDPRINMMLGFSETEVREMISYYNEAGMIKADMEKMIEEIKHWYGNYCFAEECLDTDPKMLNCEMVIYYLKRHILYGESPINNHDIFLMPDNVRYPGVKHSYILELKYLKAGDSEEEAQKQWDEGVKQVQRYATDREVEVMTRNTYFHLVVMQVRVCELVRLEEV